MVGKEILLSAVRNETTSRPAWLPFVGAHGASLISQTAQDYLNSSRLIVDGLRRAAELYRPDGLPVSFDLQMEAEVLGCELSWSAEGPPAVASHPLEEGKALPDLPVFDTGAGRFPVVMEALKTLKGEIGDEVALYGLICGPFTLSLHLMGSDIFMKMFDHPDYVKAVIGYAANVGKKVIRAYAENGADVIGVVDPMTSQISPQHFQEYCTPFVNDVFDYIREQSVLSSLFVCGDATRNLAKMCETRCDNVSIDENIPLETLRDFTRSSSKSFGGNLKLTTALLLGTEDDARLDAIRCIDIGGGCGFVLAPGCDLPFATPPENLQAVSEMVHDEYQREVAKRTIIAQSAETADSIELPYYGQEPNVIVDVITLDSSSCAPCQYMMDAVHRVSKRVSAPIAIREHRITTRAGIAMMTRLGVAKIPTICIDGDAKFISLMPDQDTLARAIETAISGKASG
jgi:MtaA/CmuA family methyltransferase